MIGFPRSVRPGAGARANHVGARFIQVYSRRRIALILRVALAVVLPAAAVFAGDARQAPAYQIQQPIKLDGILNEAVWRDNPPIGEFVQAEPNPGKPPSEATQVWLAYTRDALYIAVRCDDREAARVVENRMPTREWDGIWLVKTSRNEKGWSAEFEIPFKTLGFNGSSDSWGFNVSRFIGRHREFSRWASPSLDVRFSQIARAGAITGLQGLSQGVGLDVKTYAIGGFDRDLDVGPGTTGARDGGADIFYRITPNLVSSTTFNTDFAETEADARQVNLTRFSRSSPNGGRFSWKTPGSLNSPVA